MGKNFRTLDQNDTLLEPDNLTPVKFVAVGDPVEWQDQGNLLPRSNVAYVGFHEVTEEMLSFLQPAEVFSPVLAKSFDCIELALHLHNLGYTGRYSAFTRGLPNVPMVEREVQQLCPRIKFQISLTQ